MNGQEPVSEPPFCARCLMMGADHGAVDHLQGIRSRPAFVQRVHDLLPPPRQGPAPKLAADAGPRAELLRQVSPRRSGASDPENPIQNKSVVQWLASVRGAGGQNEGFMKRPILVRHQVSCQAGLHRRYKLESRSARLVKPFSQHELAIPRSREKWNPAS